MTHIPNEVKFLIEIIGLIILIIAVLATINIFGAKEDGPLEEVTETIIEKKLGVDIDLTPNSPESNR